MFKFSDIVIIIGTAGFLAFYAMGIIVQVIKCRMKGNRFNLINVALALMIGFAGSVATFFSLYWVFGQG